MTSVGRRIRRLHARTRKRPGRIAIGRDIREVHQHYRFFARDFRRLLGIPDGLVVISVDVHMDGSGCTVTTLPREHLERAVHDVRSGR
jgi:hypothetical protein